jgi:hypothetical protein
MRVILRDNRVVSLSTSTTQYLLPLVEEEVVDAPQDVKLGWYRVGGLWIPPAAQRNERRTVSW